MSTEIINGYSYDENQVSRSLAGTATISFGYTYTPSQPVLPLAYTYVANPIQLAAVLSSQSSIGTTLSNAAAPNTASLHRFITEVLSPSTEASSVLRRISVETLSPHVDAHKRRPVTFLILD